MSENEISPGPWEIEGDIVSWSPRQKSIHDDQGAGILASNGQCVVMGGSQDEQGGAVGVLRMPDAIAIAALPDTLAERDALRAEVERLRTTSRCAWCGAVIAGESAEDRGRLALEHLLICADHPLRQLEKRIAELTAEAERLRELRDSLAHSLEFVSIRNDQLQSEVSNATDGYERLRETLAWYADEDNWVYVEGDSEMTMDSGDRARAALAGEEP